MASPNKAKSKPQNKPKPQNKTQPQSRASVKPKSPSKSGPTKAGQNTKVHSVLHYEFKLLGLIIATAFTLLALHTTSAGAIGSSFKTVLLGLLSMNAFFLPYVVFTLVFMAINPYPALQIHKLRVQLASVALYFAIILFVGLNTMKFGTPNFATAAGMQSAYEKGLQLAGGGAIGNFLFYLFYTPLGSLGTVLVTLGLIVLFLTLAVHITPSKIIAFIGLGAKKTTKQIVQTHQTVNQAVKEGMDQLHVSYEATESVRQKNKQHILDLMSKELFPTEKESLDDGPSKATNIGVSDKNQVLTPIDAIGLVSSASDSSQVKVQKDKKAKSPKVNLDTDPSSYNDLGYHSEPTKATQEQDMIAQIENLPTIGLHIEGIDIIDDPDDYSEPDEQSIQGHHIDHDLELDFEVNVDADANADADLDSYGGLDLDVAHLPTEHAGDAKALEEAISHIKILDFQEISKRRLRAEGMLPKPAIEEPILDHDIEIVELDEPIDDEESMPTTAAKPTPVAKPTPELIIDEDSVDIVDSSEVFTYENYVLPSTSQLKEGLPVNSEKDRKDILMKARLLEDTLANFKIEAKVVQVSKGPMITRFEIQPSPGVKVSRIVNLADDIALNLAATTIRIVAPIPGKAAVGIEVPNKTVSVVTLRDVIETEPYEQAPSTLRFGLGKEISGQPVVADLAKMPHLLIAGSTGSGKSVCVNTIISSLLFNAKPDEVKFLMIDPKVVELNVYNGIPHLILPVVTDPKKASIALNWAVQEMTDRYNKFAEFGVRDVTSYNKKYELTGVGQYMPRIVVIIDELADLMMVAPNQVEDAICRLAQMARAAGIHLIVATQRPSVDVITGVIKANIPSRIAFAVSSQIDSRTIIDMAGAEKLLGKGDMLYFPVGESKPKRVQGSFISEEEVEALVTYVKDQVGGRTVYDTAVLDDIRYGQNADSDDDLDELLEDAIRFVIETEKASTSLLQRRFRIGYNRAARLVEELEARGVVGPSRGSKPREINMTWSEYQTQILGE